MPLFLTAYRSIPQERQAKVYSFMKELIFANYTQDTQK